MFVLDWLSLFAHTFRESRILVISFCNLIAGTLSEPPEVNAWFEPPNVTRLFLPRTERRNESGDEAK